MACDSKCSRVLLYSVLVLILVLNARSSLIKDRHRLVNTVAEPDDERFSLSNLAKISDKQLAKVQKKFRKSGLGRELLTRFMRNSVRTGRARNPFKINQKCKRDKRSEFRRINGTCNNFKVPFLGAAKTPLGRFAGVRYEDGVNAPRLTYFLTEGDLPSARVISLAVHGIVSNISKVHSHMLMNIGQFIDHDLSLTPEAFGEGGVESPKEECCEVKEFELSGRLRECLPIRVSSDPIFTTRCIEFLRSSPVPGLPGSKKIRFQLNDLTSYVDASHIYGSTNIRAASLRTFSNGLLKTSSGVDGEVRLPEDPKNPDNCESTEEECRFEAGDIRNSEQAALTSLHTLFLREHNRVARILGRLNRDWDDERIYQVTRKILGAVSQVITYGEFLPEVVGPEVMDKFKLRLLTKGRFTGYDPTVDPSIVMEFSSAAFRFGHSLIRETFGTSPGLIEIEEVFEAFLVTENIGSDRLLNGLANVNVEGNDRFITTGLRDNLFGEEMDLPAFNIQRGRDHGIDSYNSIRRRLGLNRFKEFEDLVDVTHFKDSADALKEVYPQVADIEIFPGGMSEIPVNGGLVGETFAHIIGEQFKRLKFGDRFWHETDDKVVKFTNDQLEEIRKASLAAIFCANVENPSVRKYLLLAESNDNPTVDCSEIVQMDFKPFKE